MAIPFKNDNPINFNSLMINDDEFEVEEIDEGVKNIPNKTLSISKLKNKLKNSDKFKKRKSKSLNDFNIEKLKKDMIDSLLNSVDNNNKNYIDSCNSNIAKILTLIYKTCCFLLFVKLILSILYDMYKIN